MTLLDAIETQVIGDAAGDIQRVLERLLDFSDLLPRLGALAMDSQKKNIEESRSPEGTPYAPLKNARHGILGPALPSMHNPSSHSRFMQLDHPYADKPLLDTTNMYQSIHFELRPPDSVFAGPSLAQAPYFPYQNQGAPRAGIPVRSFIGLRSEDTVEIKDLIFMHNTAALEGM